MGEISGGLILLIKKDLYEEKNHLNIPIKILMSKMAIF